MGETLAGRERLQWAQPRHYLAVAFYPAQTVADFLRERRSPPIYRRDLDTPIDDRSIRSVSLSSPYPGHASIPFWSDRKAVHMN